MSPTAVVGIIAGGLFVVFGALSVLAIGLAAWKRRVDTITARSRETVRETLFERQKRSHPEWERWTESLSATERDCLIAVLDRYLRVVEGEQRETFLDVAAALDLGERSDAALDRSAVVPRLRALARLAMLDHPLTVDRLLETCSDTQRTREAAARLLYERRDEYENAAELGSKLILWDGQEPITIYGLETLADLNTGGETPLLHQAADAVPVWRQSILIQTCFVLEHTEQIDPDAPIDWLFPLLEHESPTVRTAAVRAFKQQGWRDAVRTRLDLRSLITDNAANVRRATYDVLTYWGDEQSRDYLEWATITEADERCQLVAVRGLQSLETPREGYGDQIGLRKAWEWVEAELAVSDQQGGRTSPGSRPVHSR
ncbi:HEAT repeat domain-containing protein [Halopenitus persicus]|uniref:HEAT repeat domain-containing protein n=1 Tax=Halopenitus persicus TaxID=1048396 RepID=UPI000BBA5BBD|nr:HEAT repeat domain-containing protein [Halopenitus persicus]